MTLKQLEVFLAVADTHSFSKGGELVSLAQSTASQHIRALEDELQVRLFDRSTTQVRLTEVGRLFYKHASQITGLCEDAKSLVKQFQGLEQATLRIAASTIPAACLIPDLLGRFSTAWPGVRMELQQGDTREVIRLLQDDQVELAVVGGQSDHHDISFQCLMTERIVLVSLPDTNIPCLSLQQLQDLPLVIREQGSGTRTAVETILQKSGFDPRRLSVVAQLGSSEAVRRAVLGGAGSAFVSTLSIGRELAEGTLVELCVDGLEVTRSFYLAWRKGRTLSPAAKAFMVVLQEATAG